MVRETSIETYKRIMDNGLLSKRREQVYSTLYENGLITGTKLAVLVKNRYGSWGHSETIRNRITELKSMGVVDEVGPKEIDGKSVFLFRTNDNLPKKLVVKKTKTQRIKELEIEVDALREQVRVLKQRDKVFYSDNDPLPGQLDFTMERL